MGGVPIYIYTLAKALKLSHVDQIIISSGGTMEPQFIQSGVSPFSFNIKSKFEFHPKVFLALPAIIKKLREEKIEIIHAHTRVGQVLAAMVKLITGVPFITTSHGFFKRRLGRRIFPAWGETVIAISEPVGDDLIQTHRMPSNRVRQIRNGIELSRFSFVSNENVREANRKKWGMKPGDFVVCMISRMIEQKGVADLLLATKIVLREHPQLKVLIVGDGPCESQFMQKSFELGLENSVTFTGNLLDVTEILAICDVFVHPMRVSEGFGLSIAEAMASGLPVIITDQCAIWKLLRDKNVGECVAKESPNQIAEVLSRWIQSPETTVQMGQNARRVAIELFDIRDMAKAVMQVYVEALNQR